MDKFWPESALFHQRWIVTDSGVMLVPGWRTHQAHRSTWCENLADFAMLAAIERDNVLLFQEDFFLNSPVQTDLIYRAEEQMRIMGAGMVRLYPSPGANKDYGDPHFGLVDKGTRYRISCQASIWKSDFLYQIASRCKDHGEPTDFETGGTPIAEEMPESVLAFKRERQPWPISYLCSAIGNGRWSHDARRLCEANGIDVDFTQREFQSA
jgi:hypothetical protein